MSKSKMMSDFNNFLDEATSKSEANSKAITSLSNMIEENEITPEDALQSIHLKITDENPQVVLLGLEVLDIIFLKCGSIIHKVICTKEYMELLGDIIKSTEHITVKEQILKLLEKWADLFKYFPQYSHPQRLLESLKSGSKFDQDDNRNVRFEQFKKNYGLQSKTYSAEIITGVNNSNTNDVKSEVVNTPSKKNDNDFESELHEYQKQRKLDYKKHLKSQGLPTSSDEEDNTIAKGEQASCTLNMNESLMKIHKLPKDLENSKKQRQKLNEQTRIIRALTHKKFLENCNHNCTELRQCQNSECEWAKKKIELEETVIPKQWPLEVRKIKQSKKQLANQFEEYKNSKKESYYAQKTDTGIRQNSENTNIIKKPLNKGEAEEQEQLEQAILLSQIENEPLVGQDIYLKDEEMLQLAIDMSFAEADNNHISPKPKSDDEEDLELSFAKKLSLDESRKEKIASDHSADTSIGLCIVCHARNFLKRFEPCNHKCICDECADAYTNFTCPICKEYFSEISWDL